MCKVISVSNQKGGVGKTVTCVNLGIGLAREGYKVLMIDADPQGSLSISLGFDEPDKLEKPQYDTEKFLADYIAEEKSFSALYKKDEDFWKRIYKNRNKK